MENASKALLMAGGVLIAIIIISIFVILKSSFDNTAQSYVDRLDVQELQKYNSNFEVYEYRTDVTPQEIVSLINFAKQKDQQTEIEVEEDGSMIDLSDQNVFLETYLNSKFSYKGIVVEEGKVTKIIFKKNIT